VSRETVLVRAQTAALAGMVDTVTVKRLNPATTVTNADTGVITPGWTTVYTGVAKVQQRTLIARPSTVAEAEVYVSRLELHLPMTAAGVLADDIVTVTASPHNANLVGHVYHVRGPMPGTWRSAQRFEVIEVTS
jgi:hypothetical protein